MGNYDKETNVDLLKEFSTLLDKAQITITGYDEPTATVKMGRKSMGIQDLVSKLLATQFSTTGPTELTTKIMERASLISLAKDKAAELAVSKSTPVTSLSEAMKNNYILAVDVFSSGSEEEYLVLNKEYGVEKISPQVYKKALGIKDLFPYAVPVIREYRPREDWVVKDVSEVEGTKSLNTYSRPKWTSVQMDKPKLPKEVLKLINHLVPSKEDQEFLFHWMYMSIVDRASVYLVMCGEPAIGKNRFKILLRALHGALNSVDGKKSTLTTRFNSQLTKATYVHFDELKYTMEEENVMKEIPNNTISIEEKNKDATRSTKIFCSMVISNNKPRDNYLSFDARKFAPLMLNDKRLETSMTPEEISLMSEKMEDEESDKFDINYVANIGHWILKHGRSDKFPNGEYRGPKFWQLAHTSMATWQKALIRGLTDPSVYSTRKTNIAEKLHNGTLQYSELVEAVSKHKHNSRVREKFPGDYSTGEHFFKIFRGLNGEAVFSTKPMDDKLFGDFFIEAINLPALHKVDLKGKGSVEDLL